MKLGDFFYNINYMLNSEHLSLVNKIGDKSEFTITRVHCTSKKKGNRLCEYSEIRNFVTLSNNFSFDMPTTLVFKLIKLLYHESVINIDFQDM